jgi:nucleoside-diphosphate-sugar epimerase
MKKALVAGALGVSGRALVNHLLDLGDWEVIGLSRRKPEFKTLARYIAIDLLQRSDVETCVDELGEVTHIFFAALQMGGNFFEEIAPNLAMLQNTVEAVTARTLVPTRPRQRKAIHGKCRLIFTMTRRTILQRSPLESPGPGQPFAPAAFAASRWATL